MVYVVSTPDTVIKVAFVRGVSGGHAYVYVQVHKRFWRTWGSGSVSSTREKLLLSPLARREEVLTTEQGVGESSARL